VTAQEAGQQPPCILIFPPPPGCASQPIGRITVNAGGPYGGLVGQAVVFRATVASPLPPGTSFQFQWSFGDGTTGLGQTTSHIYRGAGVYGVTVTVFGGGQTASATVTASITQPSQPLQVSAGGPYSGRTGAPVQFASSVSGAPPGSGLTYQWSFGDGGFGTGAAPSYVYNAPGTYNVSLQVRTSSGQAGFASSIVQVTRPVSPIAANPGGPYSGTAGSSVTFFGSAFGAANPRFQWSFGDGALGSGPSVTHVYATPGVYAVSLTVTDLATGQSSQATTSATVLTPSVPVPPAVSTPQGRSFASIAYFPPSGRLVLFGGLICGEARCTDQDDTWTWDGTNWTALDPVNSPSSRYGAAMAYHQPTGRRILFGGVDCSGDTCADSDETWAFDGTSWTQFNPAARPGERSDAAMVFDSARGVLLLFGGTDTGGEVQGDTWAWTAETWTLLSPSNSPPARYGAGMAFDAARGVAVLFGGTRDGTTGLNDTWTWDGTAWTEQRPPSSPTARSLLSLAYDAARGVVVLFGGVFSGNQGLGDTWTWNGSTWTQQNPSSAPSQRYGSAAAYDPTLNAVVLFSGTNGASDTWLWSGAGWTQR
jgi:PKD repeat protein